MEVFKLPKPAADARIEDVLPLLNLDSDLRKCVEATNRPVYLYWDKVRYKPRPKGLSAEQFWTLIKFLRRSSSSRVTTMVSDEQGNVFTWQFLPGQEYFLHEIDMELGGRLASDIVEGEATRRRYIARGIMEEAIASSQLEGANTTRRVAKRMLIEKRSPVNKSEQMILNNYNTMLAVENQYKDKEMTVETLLDLHVMLTKDTIDDGSVGRFRKDGDEIVVGDAGANVIYHVPPPVPFVKREIKKLVQYANDASPGQHFVHPLIKAVILHFWMGFLHPFVDGNGRLARTLFYWYLLKNGYWAFAYLPVSKVIKKSPAQYRDAYVYSEQDDNDLTYFIDYNIRKIEQAKKDFEAYVKRKETDNRKMAGLARAKYHLNDRQIQLLRYMHKNSDASTTIKTHAHVYGITRPTSKKDLEELEKLGFLESSKQGRDRPFRGTEAISELF